MRDNKEASSSMPLSHWEGEVTVMKKWFVIATVVGILVMGIGMAQMAQAADDYKAWGLRFRALYVIPNVSTDGVLSTLHADVTADLTPEIDLEYFFTKIFSVELMAAVTYNDIKLNGNYAGSTWLLPPTLTAKYHPFAGSLVSPYVGAGINVTLPFNSNVNGVSDFKIDNSVGWVLQAGADVKITENMYLNFDYKYVNMNTSATVAGSKCKLDLSPSLIGVGVGYRF
jgi:outer membrane protein